jgi:hypothetical protein
MREPNTRTVGTNMDGIIANMVNVRSTMSNSYTLQNQSRLNYQEMQDLVNDLNNVQRQINNLKSRIIAIDPERIKDFGVVGRVFSKLQEYFGTGDREKQVLTLIEAHNGMKRRALLTDRLRKYFGNDNHEKNMEELIRTPYELRRGREYPSSGLVDNLNEVANNSRLSRTDRRIARSLVNIFNLIEEIPI